jgi:hypothetical protein
MRRLALWSLLLISAFAAPAPAADRLEELRRAFTVDGKPIPPRIFADFSDATLSDSRPIVDRIDALAGMGSGKRPPLPHVRRRHVLDRPHTLPPVRLVAHRDEVAPCVAADGRLQQFPRRRVAFRLDETA